MIPSERRNFEPELQARPGPAEGSIAPSKIALGEPLRVSDIRQYVYCPRIVYFNYVVPVPRITTVKMDEGLKSHAEFSDLESRRTLARYGLEEGTREFRVYLESRRLGIAGRLDLLISTRSNVYPVEFKDTQGEPGLHHKYQLVAYAMMAEEARGKPAKAGFIYVIPKKKVFRVAMDESARVFTRRIISAMVNIIRSGTMPRRTRWGGRCRDCEFRNYCRGA